jgi:membrane protease YdiL (CAAX protease family)
MASKRAGLSMAHGAPAVAVSASCPPARETNPDVIASPALIVTRRRYRHRTGESGDQEVDMHATAPVRFRWPGGLNRRRGGAPLPADRETARARYATRSFLIAPIVLIIATYAVFRLLIPAAGERTASFAGFAFYWLVGGIALPVALIGRDGVAALFERRPVRRDLRFTIALILLALPVAFGFLFAFPAILPFASGATLAGLAAYAVVNGTLEEIFWRGTFARRFPSNPWLGVIYPAVIFSLWQLVPWAVFPSLLHVPAFIVLGVALPVGLLYNWVAWRTGSIHWTVLSHVLTNLSGVGAMVIFGPGW